MKKFFDVAYLVFKYVCILFGGIFTAEWLARKVTFEKED